MVHTGPPSDIAVQAYKLARFSIVAVVILALALASLAAICLGHDPGDLIHGGTLLPTVAAKAP